MTLFSPGETSRESSRRILRVTHIFVPPTRIFSGQTSFYRRPLLLFRTEADIDSAHDSVAKFSLKTVKKKSSFVIKIIFFVLYDEITTCNVFSICVNAR